MNIIRRTLDIDTDTDTRLRQMADERGQDVAAVLAEAVALLDGKQEDDDGERHWDDVGMELRRDDLERARLNSPFDLTRVQQRVDPPSDPLELGR